MLPSILCTAVALVSVFSRWSVLERSTDNSTDVGGSAQLMRRTFQVRCTLVNDVSGIDFSGCRSLFCQMYFSSSTRSCVVHAGSEILILKLPLLKRNRRLHLRLTVKRAIDGPHSSTWCACLGSCSSHFRPKHQVQQAIATLPQAAVFMFSRLLPSLQVTHSRPRLLL